MSLPRRISFVMMAGLLLLIGGLHMATLFLTALFSYFALRCFTVRRNKVIALLIFSLAVTCIGFGVFHFSRQAFVALPKIAETSIPAAVDFAEKHDIVLPFSDWNSLKHLLLGGIKGQFANIGRITREAAMILVYLVIGIVLAVSLFLSTRISFDEDPMAEKNSLYSTATREIAERFAVFYRSFATVMGAQLAIAVINSTLTAAFLFWARFPHAPVLVVITFLCGLLPIIGNITSNTLIVGVGFSLSPDMAFAALVFLVVIHKLEYLLNSKIIGDRIKNPMWLTLTGILLGEKLMGIPGIILAPVVLHYIKTESSLATASESTKNTESGEKPPN